MLILQAWLVVAAAWYALYAVCLACCGWWLRPRAGETAFGVAVFGATVLNTFLGLIGAASLNDPILGGLVTILVLMPGAIFAFLIGSAATLGLTLAIGYVGRPLLACRRGRLRRGMASPRSEVRRRAVEGFQFLGVYAGDDAILVADAALSDDHPEIRRAAIATLPSLGAGNSGILTALQQLCQDSTTRVAALAMVSLSRCARPPAGRVLRGPFGAGWRPADRFGELTMWVAPPRRTAGPPAGQLFEPMFTAGVRVQVFGSDDDRTAAAVAVASLGEEIRSKLIAKLHDGSPERLLAIRAFEEGEFVFAVPDEGGGEIIHALTAVARDGDEAAREAAERVRRRYTESIADFRRQLHGAS